MAPVVVDADRPESVDGHILDAEPIDCLAVVVSRGDVESDGFVLRIAAPGGGRPDQAPDRIDLAALAEHALGVGNRLSQVEQGVAHLDLARSVPIRNLERSRPAGLADLDRVLQRADGFDVLRIVRVDENAHRDDDVSGANPVLAQRMDAGAVDDLGRVLVFVDHLHRQEALAGVRKRDRDRTGVEIEHRRRIERIAVHPDHGLPGERRRLPPMHELAETSVLDDSAEKEVRFRPGEIVGGDDDRPIGGGRMRAAKRAQRQRHEQGADRETERAHSCDGFARGSPAQGRIGHIRQGRG